MVCKMRASSLALLVFVLMIAETTGPWLGISGEQKSVGIMPNGAGSISEVNYSKSSLDFRIMLKTIVFDPLKGVPDMPLKISEYPDSVPGYYIVQMNGEIKDVWKKEIEKYKGTIAGYIPNYALIVKMDKIALEHISKLQFVRWIGIYQPYYKVQPDIWTARENQQYKILIFGNEDFGMAVHMLSRCGVEIDSATPGRLYHTLRATLSPAQVSAVAYLPFVAWIEKESTMHIMNSISAGVIQSGTSGNTPIWNHGLYGDGQIVGESDTGIDWDHEAFRDPDHYQVQYSNPPGSQPPDLNHRKIVNYHVYVDDYDLDNSGHGTHVACTIAGNNSYVGGTNANGRGMAPSAKISFTDIGGQGDSLSLPADLNQLYLWAYNDGARLHSNSWGDSNNDYGSEAMQTDEFMWEHKDMLVFFAAGNSGPGANTVGNPGTAKNIVTVGASSHDGSSIASFSSRGPTADGRRKPTVVAPGESIYSADSDGNLSSNNSGYIPMSGTSMATPTCAGAGALVRQYYTEGWYPTGTKVSVNAINPSGSLIKATLIAGARKISGNIPDNNQGWGLINLEDSLYFSGDINKMRIVDDWDGVSTAQSADYIYYISEPTPLRFVLTWTDYPGNPAASKDIVNDLDLVVISPTNTTYLGNVFSNSESVPGGSADSTNVEECVYLNSPTTGLWIVRVIGKNVPFGPQPFSLVVTGGIDNTRGEISLDRNRYKEDDIIRITVTDLDATSSTLTVMINSTTEQTPETVTLTEIASGSKKFTGSIRTSLVNSPGVLQVSNNDDIIAVYADTSAPGWYGVAHAIADTTPPVISNVQVSQISATSALIQWSTDEPANSAVKYGTASPATQISDATYTSTHTVKITGLTPDTTYVFDVYSNDTVGHLSGDDNNGLHYTFTTLRGDILLVDDDSGVNLDVYYADSIKSKNWLYGYWEYRTQGVPGIYYLQNFKAVVWHCSDAYPQLGLNETNILKGYMDIGGNVFISGQDIGWDIYENGGSASQKSFYTNYLHATYNADVTWDSQFTFYPPTQANIYGTSGDPISGSYTAGTVIKDNMNYGFYPDDITNNGGTVTFQQDTFDYSGQPNGRTDAGIRYAGTYKVVYFSFAFEDIQNSDARNDIMDKILSFLTGTSPPAITVTAPNGGEVLSGTVTITWNAGNADHLDILYSRDGGTTWNTIATGVSPAGSYAWDTTALPDGTNYRIGIYAVNAANISAFDVSDANFTLNNGNADHEKPEIVHTPITSWLVGTSISINATITDNKGVHHATLYYKKASDTTYTTIPMNNMSATYTAQIPGSTVTLDGLNYYIYAIDINGNSNQTPVYNITVYEKSLQASIQSSAMFLRPGATASILITVTESGIAVENANVSITAVRGTIYPSYGVTNASGQFSAEYTAPAVSEECEVEISAVASLPGYADGLSHLTIKIVLPPMYAEANLSETNLNPNESAELEIFVYDENSIAIDGAWVEIYATNGLYVNNTTGTTEHGLFSTTLRAPYVSKTTICAIYVNITRGGYNNSYARANVTVYPESASLVINMTPYQNTIRCYENMEIPITVTAGGNPVSGANLTVTASFGAVVPGTVKTNTEGRPYSPVIFSPAIVTAATNATITVKAEKTGYKNATSYLNITVLPMLSLVVEINSVTAIEEGHTLNITVVVSAEGMPVEDAEVSLTVTLGNKTCFSHTDYTDVNGNVVFTFNAPDVEFNSTIRIIATATGENFIEGNASMEIMIIDVPEQVPSNIFETIPMWLLGLIVGIVCLIVVIAVIYALKQKSKPPQQQMYPAQPYYMQAQYPGQPQQPQNPPKYG